MTYSAFRSALLLISGIATALALAPRMAGAETARGLVYEDLDADGQRDAGERGLPGVAVSNGEDVVETDAEGRWQLDCEDGTILYVVKPTDYAVATDENHVPRFYYAHRPQGTPAEFGLRYPGLEPSGPLPASIEFGLTPQTEPRRFRMVAFADTQPESGAELDYLRDDVVAELVGVDATFGITCGDILYDDHTLAGRYQRLLGQIGIPWYAVPGNHEINFMAPDDANSLETFHRNFGPSDYSFDVAGVHFIVLDTVEYDGVGEPESPNHPRPRGSYRGHLVPRQLRWLKNDLARVPEDQLVVISMHIPLVSHLDQESPRTRVDNRRELFDVLDGRRHALLLAGHMHTVEHFWFTEEDGWKGPEPLHQHTLAAACGSWWGGPRDARGIPVSIQRDGTPNGYTIFTFEGTEVTARFQAASLPADHQMRISLDHAFHQNDGAIWPDYRPGELLAGPITLSEVPATRVVVNVFDAGPRSRVWLGVDDREPEEIPRVFRPDPFLVELYGRQPELFKSFVEPVVCSHIWEGTLPARLSPGAHTLHVRAVDEYGQEHRSQRVFEVTAP